MSGDPVGQAAPGLTRRELLVGATAVAASGAAVAAQPRPPVIDIHTHMYSRTWQQVLRDAGDPGIRLTPGPNGDQMFYLWASVGTLSPAMFDWPERIRLMDAAGIDIAIISLSSPNAFLVARDASVAAARAANDEFAAMAARYPTRIRWMASLPWDFESDALAELRRARDLGAVGVCLLTNIHGESPTLERYWRVWSEVEASGLPVFIHPTLPKVDYGLMVGGNGGVLGNAIGFTTETTLCFGRMIFEGFLDRFPALRLIACHGGGSLPFLAARFDRTWQQLGGATKPSRHPPSHYIRHHLYYDAIVYDAETLAHLTGYVDASRVMYGSDYPFSLGDMPGLLARVDALPATTAAALRGGNASRLFAL